MGLVILEECSNIKRQHQGHLVEGNMRAMHHILILINFHKGRATRDREELIAGTHHMNIVMVLTLILVPPDKRIMRSPYMHTDTKIKVHGMIMEATVHRINLRTIHNIISVNVAKWFPLGNGMKQRMLTNMTQT